MPRTSRRRRASTYPERSNQKYHVFITFHLHGEIDEKIEYNKIINWCTKFEKEHMRLPSTFELRRYLIKTYKHDIPYEQWEHDYQLDLETDYSLATLWQVGESMDDTFFYRNSDPKPKLTSNMYYKTNINTRCNICLDTVEDERISLSACHCVFHKTCIEKAYGFSNYCPICSSNIHEVLVNDADYENPVLEIIL